MLASSGVQIHPMLPGKRYRFEQWGRTVASLTCNPSAKGSLISEGHSYVPRLFYLPHVLPRIHTDVSEIFPLVEFGERLKVL